MSDIPTTSIVDPVEYQHTDKEWNYAPMNDEGTPHLKVIIIGCIILMIALYGVTYIVRGFL